jgi:hypothetical protein
MPDRELLEAAAKAAGLVAHRYCEPWKAMAQYTLHDGYFGPSWNPLTDDGDALRLAVKLGFTVNPYQEGVFVSRYEGEEVVGEPFAVMGQPDTAATRRAIVRAAAAMCASPKTGGAKS